MMASSAISRSWRPKLAALMAMGGLLAGAPVHSEKADRNSPVNIESNRMNADDARKIAVFEGQVILTQGTLTIRAERITVRQDREGFQYGTAIGNPATFRQKRDGADEYIDAEAKRIEYDARADKVEFFDNARLRRDGGDAISGNYIAYDARTERFTVSSQRDPSKADPQDRVRAVIQPRQTGASAAPTTGKANPATGSADSRGK